MPHGGGMEINMKNTCTIGCAGAKFSQNKIFYFRKKFTARAGGRLDIKIFADAAYKLYINGEFVGAGPAKGNDGERYFDERALGEYLTDGENEMLVSVLCLACAEDLPGHRFVTSLLRSGRAALEISGTLDGAPFATDESWECAEERAVDFLTPEYAYYTGICEHVRGELPLKWTPAQVLIDWHLAKGLAVIPKAGNPEHLASNWQATELNLSDADVAAIDAMDDPDGRMGPDPREL